MSQSSVRDQWKAIQRRLEGAVGDESFRMYLKNTLVIQLEPEQVEIGVPNLVLADYLEARFEKTIAESIESELGFVPEKIKFSVNGHLFRRFRDSQKESENGDSDKVKKAKAAVKKPKPEKDSEASQSKSQIFHMNERFRLEGFIVGSSNKLAFNCAVETAQNPGRRYSTLYIYGSCGTGKTHLLQGIARKVEEMHPKLNTLYVSGEYFINQFLAALSVRRKRKGTTALERFRDRFRKLNVFLMDDIQFFRGKPKCQEELLHTLIALESAGRQVVLASDCHPKEMEEFPERLRSRFLQGMLCHLDIPNQATRVSLIKAKIEGVRDKFPDATVNFLASSLDCNVRELEGYINQLIALAGVTGERITVPLVKEALKDFLQRSSRMVELSDIENLIISHYGVRSEDLHGRSRERNIATARQVCMYLARTMTQHSLKEIGRFFGNKNHTTVVFATQKISSVVDEDPEMAATIEHFKRQLSQR